MISSIIKFFSKKSSGSETPPVVPPVIADQPTDDGNAVLRNLIAQGDTAGALQWLQSNGHNVAMLQAQWTQADREYQKGRIDYKAWTLIQNRVNYSLLHFFNPEPEAEVVEPALPVKPVPETPITAATRSELLQLLQESGLKETLDRCKDLNNNFLMLYMRYGNAQKNFLLGLLAEEEWMQEQARVKEALETFLQSTIK